MFVEMWEVEINVKVEVFCYGCFFGEELKSFVELEINWFMEIIIVCFY